MAKVTTLVKPEADSKFGITCESEVDVDGDGIADVVVIDVAEDGLMAKAGIQEGMMILKVNGKQVKSATETTTLLKAAPAGEVTVEWKMAPNREVAVKKARKSMMSRLGSSFKSSKKTSTSQAAAPAVATAAPQTATLPVAPATAVPAPAAAAPAPAAEEPAPKPPPPALSPKVSSGHEAIAATIAAKAAVSAAGGPPSLMNVESTLAAAPSSSSGSFLPTFVLVTSIAFGFFAMQAAKGESPFSFLG